MILAAGEPAVVALDVSDIARGRGTRAGAAPHVGHAQGRARALLGARARGRPAMRRTGPCSSTASCTTSRTRSSARRVERRAASGCGCSTSMRSAARRWSPPPSEAPHGARSESGHPCRSVARGDGAVEPGRRGTRLARVAGVRGESAGLDGVVVSGEDVSIVRDVVRRGVLSRRAGHPARGIQRSRSGSRPDARGGDRARRRLPRRRPADHRRRRSRRCRARRSSRRFADATSHGGHNRRWRR